MEECAGERAVVGWLSGQCVTSGCPGAPKREVSRGKEASGAQHGQNTGNARLTSPTAPSFFTHSHIIAPVNRLYLICSILKRVSSQSLPRLLSLLLSPLSLVEGRVGGGLLAFLHRVLCARPGLGRGPYPLSTLSRFSDSHPSSSPLNTLPPPLLNLFNSPPVASLTTAPASNSVCSSARPRPRPRSLLLLSPSLTRPHVSPIIHSSLPLPLTRFLLPSHRSPWQQVQPL